MKHRRPYRSSSNDEADGKLVAEQVSAIVADFLGTIAPRFDYTSFLERIRRLTALVAVWGTRTNLTAAPGDPSEIAFHILDSLAPITCCYEFLHQEFDRYRSFLDFGSGAGFPGLVLASASPAHFTLVESRRKRASFLAVAAAEMGLRNVAVEHRLATEHKSILILSSEQPRDSSSRSFSPPEGAGRSAAFHAVTARAFAAAPEFHSMAAPLLKHGGMAIFYANPGQKLAPQEAEKAGLCEFRAVNYAIPRRGHMFQRTLGLWRRS